MLDILIHVSFNFFWGKQNLLHTPHTQWHVMNKLNVLSQLSQLIMYGFFSNLDEKKALIKEINHVVLGDFLTSFNSLIFEEDGG